MWLAFPGLFLTALATVAVGSRRSLVVEESVEQTVSSGAAFVLPIVASVVLLSLYYYFSSLQLLLSAYTAVVSLISVGLCITPLLQCAFERLRNPLSATSLRWFGASLATIIVLSWMVTGHWALNDVIGVSICVTMLSVVRLPNLRVAVICLTGLLLYDAFWVYSSPSLFGENVMVTVAMQRTDNPVYTAVNTLHVSKAHLPPKKLEMPNKLMFPITHHIIQPAKSPVVRVAEPVGERSEVREPEVSTLSEAEDDDAPPGDGLILGLGDLVVPGMLLGLAARLDLVRKKRRRKESSSVTSNNAGSEDEEALAPATVRREPSANVTHAQSPLNPCEPSQPAIGYFNCGLVGYALGFAVTFYASVAWDSPQPALVFLVPCTMVPLLCLLVKWGDLGVAWSGPLPQSLNHDAVDRHS